MPECSTAIACCEMASLSREIGHVQTANEHYICFGVSN